MATTYEQLLVALDADLAPLKAKLAEGKKEIRGVATEAAASAKATGVAGADMGDKVARGAQQAARGVESIARTGKLTAESIGNIAVMMGGPFVASAGIATVAVLAFWNKGREAARQAREEFANARGEIAAMGAAAAGRRVEELYSGTDAARARFDALVAGGDTDIRFDAKEVAKLGLAELRKQMEALIETEQRLRKEVGSGEFPELEKQYQRVTKALVSFRAEEQSLTALHKAATDQLIKQGAAEGEIAVTIARRAEATAALNAKEKEGAAADRERMKLAKERSDALLRSWEKELDRIEKLNAALDELLQQVARGDLSGLKIEGLDDLIDRGKRTVGSPLEAGLVSQADLDITREMQAVEDAIDVGAEGLVSSLSAFRYGFEAGINAIADSIQRSIADLATIAAGPIGGAVVGAISGLGGIDGNVMDDVYEKGIEPMLQYRAALERLKDVQAAASEETALTREREKELAAARSDAEREVIRLIHAEQDAQRARRAMQDTLRRMVDGMIERLQTQFNEVFDINERIARAQANGDPQALKEIDRAAELAAAHSDLARALLEELYATEDANDAARRIADLNKEILAAQGNDAELLAQERAARLDAAMSDEERALLDLLFGLQDAAKAAAEAAEAERALADARSLSASYAEQIARLQGNAALADQIGLDEWLRTEQARIADMQVDEAVKEELLNQLEELYALRVAGITANEVTETAGVVAEAGGGGSGGSSVSTSGGRLTIAGEDRIVALLTTANAQRRQIADDIRLMIGASRTLGTLTPPLIPGWGTLAGSLAANGGSVTQNAFRFTINIGDDAIARFGGDGRRLSRALAEDIYEYVHRRLAQNERNQQRHDGTDGAI